jgi:dUTP pyrophosphatase
MKVKVLEKTPGCMPEVIDKGDWIDLFTAEDVTLNGPYAKMLHRYKRENELERLRDVMFDSTLIKLGVAMELPKGCEAYLLVRSSSFKKWGILQSNSKGVIDYTYSSDKDEWKLAVIATRKVTIPKGTRIAQFRVQLSQKATWWQKIKWLFSSSIKLEKVDSLDNPERGGFGSTGEK